MSARRAARTGRPSAAVYDAFWATGGGGETYAAGVAEVLAHDHDVTLVAHEELDLVHLGERLSADLQGVGVKVIDPCDRLERISAPFDLFVNLSYRSHGRSGAARGVYVVHFPDRPAAQVAPWQRWLLRAGGLLRGHAVEASTVGGFHEPDVIRWQLVRWTNGRGELVVAPAGHRRLRLWFGRFIPGGTPREIEIEVDGRRVLATTLEPPRSRLEVVDPLHVDVPVPPGAETVRVTVGSDTVVADSVLGNGDRRRLGVPLVGLTAGGGFGDSLRGRASLLGADPPNVRHLDSYDLVIANSWYTAEWVQRWWHRPSTVVEPPVSLRRGGPKDPVILSVGRFFAPGRGHAKKQLEMVRAFRAVCGRVRGWELHLAGGCSPEDRPYLDAVRAEAAGLPVVLHVDRPGAELDALYERASIYWHATGLGEDLAADPVRAEHFGITTVEAMSAGAVPVVIDAGGQPEIVRPGIDGRLFTDVDGLVEQTVDLVSRPDERERLAATAVDRAETYGRTAFAERFRAVIGALERPGEAPGLPGRQGPGC